METFATDMEKLDFLIEADAYLNADFGVRNAECEITGELARDHIPQSAFAIPHSDERPKYVATYIGSKQKLVDWIWRNTPGGVKSAFDAFSGSAVVGYMYKTKGLRVVANDRLRYAHHTARAIIENKSVRISDDELEKLMAENSKSGDFVQKTFKGIYFTPGVHKLIDHIRANIDALSGYKKDIALFALGKTCITGSFGHFSSTTEAAKRKYSPDQFKVRFARAVQCINSLVFDNGQECKAMRKDILEALSEVKTDLAYFDPPYATHFSTTNYEKIYHFIEGLMTYWDGLEIDTDNKIRNFKTDHQTVTQGNANEFFDQFLGKAEHVPHWIISYRDHAYPSEPEMKRIIASHDRASRMKSKDHEYMITNVHGDASHAKERLFICKKAESQRAAAELEGDELRAVALALSTDNDALDVLEAIAAQERVPRVTGYMGSKHFLLGWIDKHVPKDAKSFFDAFAGGCNVAYYYKRKGLKVFANDLLKFPYHLARAVIENSKETLSAEDVEKIFEPNAQAGTFCVDHFHGYYFTKPILAWLDNAWANVQKLPGYKKDIALAALGNTCKAKARFGQFSRSKKGMRGKLSDDHDRAQHTQIGNLPLSELTETFRRYVKQVNGLVFDNGQECRVFNADVREIIPRVKADVIYCDPPYVTEFGSNDYENDLHFIEGLMTMWKGKTLSDDTRRAFQSRTRYSKESMQELFQSFIAAARRSSPALLISYRDKAFPTQDEVKGMLAHDYEKVGVSAIDVEYGIVPYEAKRGGKFAKELLFVASGPKRMAAAASEGTVEAAFHTTFPVEVRFPDEEPPSAQAINVGETPSGDKEFSFVLCHVGTNKNGDHFTREELSSRHQTAVNRKIDLKHSQDFRDIVGGIMASDFIEDEAGARVECVGELYVADNENARLAYKLMKKGVITQVSMECDYDEGECSICAKRVKSKAEYCIHLKKFKGKEFKGKPVHETLHGITFTGLGLLDRKGADENARIKQVAEKTSVLESKTPLEGGARIMAEEKQKDEGAAEDAAKKKDFSGAGGDPSKDARIKELETENQQLKARIVELQKQIETFQAKEKAAASRARAAKLMKKLEKDGFEFGDEDAKEKELVRLAGLSDDAFTATEAAYARVPKPQAQSKETRDDKDTDPGKDRAEKSAKDPTPKAVAPKDEKPEAKAATEGAMRTDAGVKPLVVDDQKLSLEERLKSGMMAAYKDRVAVEV